MRPSHLPVALLLLTASCRGTEVRVPTWSAVSAGPSHTCALTTTGVAWCWGSNVSGRLGDGTGADSPVPVRVAGSLRFTRIAAGFSQSCGIRDNGAALCWGENGNGELGDGTTTDRLVPTAVAGGLTFHAIATGEGLSCGLTASDSGLYCWGVDIGGGTSAPPRDHLRPARYAPGRYLAVSVGYEIACALRSDRQAVCWGYGAEGQLGDGAYTSSDIPVPVDQSASGPFVSVSSGHDHSCAITPAGAVWCWGNNGLGQLGAPSPLYQGVPLQAAVGGADRLEAHSAGHTCALRGGAAFCWGTNSTGQLGDGGQPGGITARRVAGGATFQSVTTGFGHSCAIDAAGALWCWGSNALGQLGTGAGASSNVPVRVAHP
jgi:alpha-tubulin suppressor-like RCC1 family protein